MPGMPGKHVIGAEELTLSAVFTHVFITGFTAVGSKYLISA
jgi:hypothetical protein